MTKRAGNASNASNQINVGFHYSLNFESAKKWII